MALGSLEEILYFLVIYVDLCCVLEPEGAVDMMTGTALS